MANVIIRSDERRQREEQILKDFGYNPNAAKEEREKAEYIAEKVNELKKNWRD